MISPEPRTQEPKTCKVSVDFELGRGKGGAG